jgi:Protein of unknown function (DUF3551)
MKTLLFFVGPSLAVLTLATSARAQNYPWCSNFHDGGGVNCGFSSYEQCMATAQGSGGTCTKNNMYQPSAGSSPARHPARRHRQGRNP